MAHKIEAGHQQDQVDKQQPVSLQRDFALPEERLGNAASTGLGSTAYRFSRQVHVRLR